MKKISTHNESVNKDEKLAKVSFVENKCIHFSLKYVLFRFFKKLYLY